MKAIIILYVLTAGIGLAQGTTDSGWFWQNPLPQGNFLNAVAVLDPNTAVAVGALGMIVRTTDGGATWKVQWSGTTQHLFGVSFTDANTGTVVGDNGTILRTADGGGTWKGQSSRTGDLLVGGSFTEANSGSAGGVRTSVIQ